MVEKGGSAAEKVRTCSSGKPSEGTGPRIWIQIPSPLSPGGSPGANHGLVELNLRRIELEVRADNQRAIELYRAAGFCEEGRLRQRWADHGAYVDVIVMGLLRPEAK